MYGRSLQYIEVEPGSPLTSAVSGTRV